VAVAVAAVMESRAPTAKATPLFLLVPVAAAAVLPTQLILLEELEEEV
jgi:hypothetical protein